VQGQSDLFQVVDALGSAGRLASGLHGGQQERDQYRDNGDHDQKLDQRESATAHLISPTGKNRVGTILARTDE
jgi:hypothetical protein